MLNFYFNPTGRIKRSTWWLHTIIIWVGGVALGYVLVFVMVFVIAFLCALAGIYPLQIEGYAELAGWGVYAIALWCWIALSIKRLHDRDRSAWWMLLWVATIIGAVIWLVMVGFQAGTSGTNRYGDEP